MSPRLGLGNSFLSSNKPFCTSCPVNWNRAFLFTLVCIARPINNKNKQIVRYLFFKSKRKETKKILKPASEKYTCRLAGAKMPSIGMANVIAIKMEENIKLDDFLHLKIMRQRKNKLLKIRLMAINIECREC